MTAVTLSVAAFVSRMNSACCFSKAWRMRSAALMAGVDVERSSRAHPHVGAGAHALARRLALNTQVIVARPDEPAAVAGDRLIAGKAGALPIVEPNGRLVGILTTGDLARWATQHMTGAG